MCEGAVSPILVFSSVWGCAVTCFTVFSSVWGWAVTCFTAFSSVWGCAVTFFYSVFICVKVRCHLFTVFSSVWGCAVIFLQCFHLCEGALSPVLQCFHMCEGAVSPILVSSYVWRCVITCFTFIWVFLSVWGCAVACFTVFSSIGGYAVIFLQYFCLCEGALSRIVFLSALFYTDREILLHKGLELTNYATAMHIVNMKELGPFERLRRGCRMHINAWERLFKTRDTTIGIFFAIWWRKELAMYSVV